MPDVKKMLNNLIFQIQERPGFLFPDDYTFNDLKYIIYGYLLSLDDQGNNLNIAFTEWLNDKYHRKASVLWGDYIFYIIANENEKKAIEILIKDLKLFTGILS